MFFTGAAPVEMPRAEGWLVKEDGKIRLEDRFEKNDLWYSQSVIGAWFDDDTLRGFTLAELKALPPSVRGTETRESYEGSLTLPDKRNDAQLQRGIAALTGMAVNSEYARPHQTPNAMKDVRYYEGTNEHAIVCAFLPRKADHWSVAVWELGDEDDREEMRGKFEDGFWKELEKGRRKSEELRVVEGKKKRVELSERELLKRDAKHSIAAYDEWHFADGGEFVILDDLKDGRQFVASLTNDLAVWRGRFAAALPTKIDTTNTLCVARIFRRRADFLAAAGEDMQWAAAYWSPSRRELVACLPPDGDLTELRKTFRHEAFHQYLSYATAMISTSPWLNEGYAQYFEDSGRNTFDLAVTEEQWDEIELFLPGLFGMDYSQFYAGTDAARRTNYRLAWSVAYFLEHGVHEIRFDPFKDLKKKYFDALFATKDMRAATAAAFGSEEAMKMFCNEWKKFWKANAEKAQ